MGRHRYRVEQCRFLRLGQWTLVMIGIMGIGTAATVTISCGLSVVRSSDLKASTP